MQIKFRCYTLMCHSSKLQRQEIKQKFKILEFNGIASEPAHIYDPQYSRIQGYRDIFNHWKIIYQIYKKQRAKGIPSMSWSEARRSVSDYFKYMRSAKEQV